MDQILNVVKSIVKRFVLVFLGTLELPLLVDRNVLLVQNALKMKHATTKNVLIHVRELVESMQIVKLETTILFVPAHQDTLVILSSDVKLKLFNILQHQILVNHLLVDQMLNVESMEIRPLVHVFL